MTNRFQELFRLPPKLYLEGSPVIIEAGVLQKDTATNKVLVQIKLKNIAVKSITSCKVALRTYEPSGEELEGISSFSYLDINVKTGEEFGSRTPVFLPDNTTRKFTVVVTEVVFEDNTVLNLNQSEWTQIPVQRAIVEVFNDPEIVKQYEIQSGPNSAFYPEVTSGLFLCTCGNVNSESIGKCYKCYRKYDNLVKILNEESLIAKKDERLKKEQEERDAFNLKAEQDAKEAREKKEADRLKLRKELRIGVPIVIIIVIVASIAPVIKPTIDNTIAYHNATKLLLNGSYDEATKAFEALEDYKDSEEQALESQYKKAEELMDSKKYSEASKVFEALKGYKDSIDKPAEIIELKNEAAYASAVLAISGGQYGIAVDLLSELNGYKDANDLFVSTSYSYAKQFIEKGSYDSAIEHFKNAEGYKDADDLFMSTSYSYGKQLIEQGSYDSAIEYFENAEGYKDADTLKIDLTYKHALKLLSKKNYHEAIAKFRQCDGYKDSVYQILNAKHGYVIDNKTNKINEQVTYIYLLDLVEADYPGAQSIYNELYDWKVVDIAINESKISDVNMESVSIWNEWYVHFRLTGGKPSGSESSTTLSVKAIYPDGQTNYSKSENTYYDEYTGYWTFWYESPAYGAKGTFSIFFYDGDGNQIGSSSVRLTN